MLYIVKFLYNTFLLPPGVFIIAMLAVGVYLYRREKRAAIALFAIAFMLYVFSMPAFAGLIVRPLERSYAPPADRVKNADVIVMLGGGATLDTPDIGGSGHLTGSASGRLVTAARLHKKTGLPVIVSGGRVYADSGFEARIAKRQLLDFGVPSNSAIVEDRSKTTEENAILTAAIMKKRGFKKAYLVTSAFHMRRSVACFKEYGVDVIPFPTDYMTSLHSKFYPNQLAPTFGALGATGVALREYMGIIAQKF